MQTAVDPFWVMQSKGEARASLWRVRSAKRRRLERFEPHYAKMLPPPVILRVLANREGAEAIPWLGRNQAPHSGCLCVRQFTVVLTTSAACVLDPPRPTRMARHFWPSQ